MKKALKVVAIAFGVVVALFGAAAAIIAATFNPNDYKPLLIREVQQKKQRILAIPGDIKLTFFPKLGADLGKLSLSEHGGAAEFASVQSARVSLALMPLLSRQLVVDRVQVDGLHANLKRDKDGSTNFDDLLSKDDSGGQAFRFDIDGIHVSNAQLRFDDRMAGRVLELRKLALDTGRIADGVPGKLKLASDVSVDKPAVNATVALNTGLTFDLGNKRYEFKDFDAEIKGAVLQWRDVALKLAMQSFEASSQAFKVPALALEVSARDKDQEMRVKAGGALQGDFDKLLFQSPQLAFHFSSQQGGRTMEGALASPLAIDLRKHLVELPKIAADLAMPHPGGGKLALKAGGNAGIDLAKEAVHAALKGNLDSSAFDAKLGMKAFSSPLYTFDVGIDTLDLDHYLAAPAAAQKTTTGNASGNANDKPADFSGLRALHDLRAEGALRVGALKVKNIRMSNARLGLHAAGGKLEVNPLALDLYGGHANGAMSLTVAANASQPLRFATQQTLAGIDVGPLLKDAAGKDTLEGKGDVQLDVSANGNDIVELKKTLAGTARLNLRDGAVRGVNIAQAVRTAKAKIGAVRGDAPPQSGTASAAEKTDFSALSASFRIANGVAHNEDLAIKSPLLRIGGAGDIDVGRDRLDYVARATVVSTLEGPGGPELQALKGLTVPVKLQGPFASLAWHIDFAGMVSGVAQQKLDEKKEELRTRAQQKIDEQKAKLGDQLKDQLKGLLGR